MNSCSRDCLFCYFNVKGRSNVKGHRGYRAYRPFRGVPLGEFLKMRETANGRVISQQDAQESAFARDYPCLHEHMTLTRWEDGTERVTSTLTAFVDGDKWKVCIGDRDQQRAAFVAGFTLDDALRALEEGLLGHALDWRPREQYEKKPRR
jgi:hypothetical protein